MTKRTVFHVVYDADAKAWCTSVAKCPVMFFQTKGGASNEAQHLARILWTWHRRKSQVVIHNRDGKISREYTYGADPKRARG